MSDAPERIQKMNVHHTASQKHSFDHNLTQKQKGLDRLLNDRALKVFTDHEQLLVSRSISSLICYPKLETSLTFALAWHQSLESC